MTVTAKSWGRILGSTAGAVLAGPGGAVVGSLTGSLLSTVLPDFLSNVAGELTAGAVERVGNALARRLSEEDKQQINQDLQTAFRDAFREAVYDVGGQACFSGHWKGKRQDIPERVVYTQTIEGYGLWRDGSSQSDLAQQVCACLHAIDRAVEEQHLLPLTPPQDGPLVDVQRFLEAETPMMLANDFFDQVIASFLAGFRSLTVELPRFESHLRAHLLDRTLVHLGEMLKQRTPAWRAFNRLLLEGIRTEVRQLGAGQEQILKQLNTLLAQPEAQPITDWANGLADLLSATGRMEKRLDEGFDDLLTRVAAQHGEVVALLTDVSTAVEGVAYQVSMVGADVQAIFPKLEEIVTYIRGGSLAGFTVQGDRLLAEPRLPRAMLRERQAHYLERHRLFAGRETELGRIREFLQTQQQGYVFVTGPSGYGKSALLANLIAPNQERYVWYFLNQLDGTHRPLDFLRQMCEQLLAYYQMPVQSEYDLPDRVDRLEALYAQLMRMPLVRTDQPLVLVIDGIDEADANFLSDLHIPCDLPDGKFIVFSARQTGRDYIAELGVPREHLLTLTLGELHYEAIRALLQTAGSQAAAWADDLALVRQLTHVSQGDPFYLHYLVQDIVTGQMTPEQIEYQPKGLTTYLNGWWNQVVEAVHRDQELRGLMGILMVALGPMPRDDIFRIYPELEWGFDKVIGQVQRFVTRSEEEGEETYALCHPRFRDYLANDKLRNQAVSYRERLLTYCANWQQYKPSSRYAFEYFARHLSDAGRWDDLHALVATGKERQEWAYAHYGSEGSYTGYLADLQVAWEHLDGAGLNEPAMMGRQIRYMLIRSSIHSLVTNLSPELLATLVKEGVWSPTLGLTHVQQMSDELQWVRALGALAPYLSEEALQEALALIKQRALLSRIAQQERKTAYQELLVRLVNLGYLDQALDMANGCPPVTQLAILENLPSSLEPELLQKALSLAENIWLEYVRIQAMALLIPALPESEQICVISNCWQTIQQMELEQDQAIAIIALLPHVQLYRQDLLTNIVALVQRTKDPRELARTLIKLGQYLSPSQKCNVWDQAVDLIAEERITNRVELLLELIDLVQTEPACQTVFDKACTVITELIDLPQHIELLDDLLGYPQLCTNLGPHLVGLARQIDDVPKRFRALQSLAFSLEDKSLFQEACSLAQKRYMKDLALRASALTLLARHPLASRAQKTDLRQKALKTARTITDPEERVKILLRVITCLPELDRPQVLDEALTTMGSITAHQDPMYLQRWTEQLIFAGYPQTALDVIQRETDTFERELALKELIPHLSQDQLIDALAISSVIGDTDDRHVALVNLIVSLGPGECRALWRKALSFTRGILNRSKQANVLKDLIRCLPEDGLLELLETVEEMDEYHKVELLKAVAECSPETLLKDIQKAAEKIDDGHQRDQVLLRVLGRMAELGQGNKALDRVTRIQDEWMQGCALGQVAPYLSTGTQMARALKIASSIEDPVRQAQAFWRLTMQLPESKSEEVLPKALAVIQDLGDADERAELLARLSSYLPQDTRQAMLLQAKEIRNEFSRSAAVVHLLSPDLSEEVLSETLSQVLQIRDGSCRLCVLQSLLPILSLKLIESVHHPMIPDWMIADDDEQLLIKATLAARLAEEERHEEAWSILEGIYAHDPNVLVPMISCLTLDALEWIWPKALHAHIKANRLRPFEAIVQRFAELGEIERAFDIIRTTEGANVPSSWQAITPYWARLATDDLTAAYTEWLKTVPCFAYFTRSELLSTMSVLASCITALGGTEVVDASLHAIQDVARWWP